MLKLVELKFSTFALLATKQVQNKTLNEAYK